MPMSTAVSLIFALYRVIQIMLLYIFTQAAEGASISFESRHINFMNASIHNNNGSTTFNEYYLHLGYFFNPKAQISVGSCTEIIIDNSSFVYINAQRSASTTNPSTLPVIIAVYRSTLEISERSFKQNHISAARAHESNITLTGNVLFCNNTAVFGTTSVLLQGSIIRLARKINKTIMLQMLEQCSILDSMIIHILKMLLHI